MILRPLFTLLALATAAVAVPNPPPQVVPSVQEWTGGEDDLKADTTHIVLDAAQQAVLVPVAALLQADLATLLGRTGCWQNRRNQRGANGRPMHRATLAPAFKSPSGRRLTI